MTAVGVDGHLLVAESRSGDIRLFNPTAAFIWRCLEQRQSEECIARAVADGFGIGYGVALGDVAATLDAWQAAGLATFDRTRDITKPTQTRSVATAPQPGVRRAYRVGSRRFAVRFGMRVDAPAAQRAFQERVMAVLAPLRDEDASSLPEIALPIDDSFETAFGPFCRAVAQHLFGPFDWLFTLHAAVLARGAGAIAFCAAQGAGKSTMAAWLAAHGWRYYNDDLAIIDPSRNEALPLPLALGVKEGSFELLAPHYPELRGATVHRYGQKAARYAAVRAAAAAESPAPLAAIVFPRYEANAATDLHRLAPAEAARRMLDAGLVFSPSVRPEMVEWMVRLLRCTPCHEMRYSDLREAETVLRSIS